MSPRRQQCYGGYNFSQIVFDKVIECSLPNRHKGQHLAIVVEERYGTRTTWEVRWQHEPVVAEPTPSNSPSHA